MSTSSGVNARWILLGLLLVPGSGCLDTAPSQEGTEFKVTSAHDPALTREGERDQVPPTGTPASDGRLNVFLFTPEDFETMDGAWGLWDPVAPPEREPGSLVVFPGNHSATFPLDQDGRISFRVQAPEGTVLGFWVWGSTEADGAAGCQDHFFYTGPDPPPVVYTVGESGDIRIEVPFGMGCTDRAR